MNSLDAPFRHGLLWDCKYVMLDVSFRQKCLENYNIIAERVSQTWTLVGLQGNVGRVIQTEMVVGLQCNRWTCQSEINERGSQTEILGGL